MKEMIDYTFVKKGKQLRPALVFFTSQNFQEGEIQKENNSNIVDLALSIEMIHMATLIHDDVNDVSELRRGILTYNKKWEHPNPVLYGDFLFSRAFVILAQLGNLEVIQNLSKTTSQICQGEILQNLNTENHDVSVEEYINIISLKTASLIAESCRISSVLMRKKTFLQEQLYRFGYNLGLAFQIFDDYLDFTGEASVMGKDPFKDLMNSSLSLPMVHFISKKGDEAKKELQRYREKKDRKEIQGLLQESLDFALSVAKQYIVKAQEELERIPDTHSQLKTVLEQISEFVVLRKV